MPRIVNFIDASSLPKIEKSFSELKPTRRVSKPMIFEMDSNVSVVNLKLPSLSPTHS